LIFEYCPNGDLSIYSILGGFTERKAKYIFKKILLGVQALHEAGYCHRSLKLENILLDQNFNLKINNFIFATQFQQNKQPIILKESVGNLHYSSPQILVNQPYNGEKNDIFSLGIILFNLVTGKFGFSKAHINDPYYKYILSEKINKYWASLPNEITNINYSNEFKDLYIRMISFNENKRPNISEIMNHHWFDEINNLDNEQLKQLELEVKNEFTKRWDQFNQNLNDINNDNANSDIKITKL
jgi:serine/threonine protein kinase